MIKQEKMMLRAKKKSISFLLPQATRRRTIYTDEDFKRDEEVRMRKRERAMLTVGTFDEIYQNKLEIEQAEKARQSVYEGKSPQNILSASNKATPMEGGKASKSVFKFGE